MAHPSHLTPDDIASVEGLSMQTAKVCVWALFDDRVDQAQRLLAKQAVLIDPVMIKELGAFFASQWQVNALRTGDGCREHCFLCQRKLPNVGELCVCYKEARVVQYIDDVTKLDDVKEYRDQNPNGYRDIPFETHFCATPGCGIVFPVNMGNVEDALRRAITRAMHMDKSSFEEAKAVTTYRAPSLCPTCQHAAQERKFLKDKMSHEKDMLAAQRKGGKSELGEKIEKALTVAPVPKTAKRNARAPRGRRELQTSDSPALTAAVLAAGVPPSDFADIQPSAPMPVIEGASQLEVGEA